MRDYVDRGVTPPKWVTSPTWATPPPCKQALSLAYFSFTHPSPQLRSPRSLCPAGRNDAPTKSTVDSTEVRTQKMGLRLDCFLLFLFFFSPFRKEMKVVLILLIVNGTFVLCWLPHLVGAFCLTFTGGFCPFPDNFFIITTTLAMLNSGCNPFIYTLTYRKFRRAFKRVLPCFRGNNTGGRGGISQG